jgi:hypothetical protein
MKHRQDRVTFIISLTAAIACLLIVSITASAQQRGGGTRAKSAAELESNRRATTQQDLLLRGAVKDETYNPADTDASVRATLLQVKEDFERIQVLNDTLLGILKANTGFNYKSLGEMTGEIRKRAKRFKENTNLPPPAEGPAEPKKPAAEIGREEMKDALVTLNKRINSFVENPLFQTARWLDLKLGAQASSDLVTIIELSGQIKKSAERIAKSAQ